MSELDVFVSGALAGRAVQQRGSRIGFQYDEAYRTSDGATPLSLSMPLSATSHAISALAPFMRGLLPDDDEVLRRWGRDFEVSWSNPFALLSVVGRDCAGAVQFVPAGGTAQTDLDPIEWISEAEVGERIRELRRSPTAWHQVGRGGQFSLAGAQAKTALHHGGGRWGVPSGSIPTTHIIKPAIEGLDDHDLNEHLSLRLAAELGLRAAASSVRTFDGERAVVVGRYDRFERDGVWQRVHQEDMCQALAVMPSSKYQQDGGPTPEIIIGLLRRASLPQHLEANVSQFVDALLFNWLIAGTDAHAKNYGLLLRARDVRLAPLYDVASFLPYARGSTHKLRLPMKIGGTYGLDGIGRRNWERFALAADLDPEAVVARAKDLAAAVPDAVARVCSDDGVRALRSDLPALMVETISRRATACAERLRDVSGT